MMEVENGDSGTQSADEIRAADLLDGCPNGGDQSSAGDVARLAGGTAGARHHQTANHRREHRAAFLAPLIGEPWAWQSRNCWDFVCHVQSELFGRDLPRVAVPADPSKRWILQSIESVLVLRQMGWKRLTLYEPIPSPAAPPLVI
jgi:hypothetical protein